MPFVNVVMFKLNDINSVTLIILTERMTMNVKSVIMWQGQMKRTLSSILDITLTVYIVKVMDYLQVNIIMIN